MPAFSALMGLLLLSGSTAAVNPSVIAPVSPPAGGFSVTLTGYNALSGQTDSDPSITANGGWANPDVVAARSRDLADTLPFGTIIEITRAGSSTPECGYAVVAPLIGYRVITDTMNARIKNHVDVLFGLEDRVLSLGKKRNASAALGSCSDTTVRVVGHVDLTHVSDLPATQAELIALVKGVGIPAQANLALAK